jgi:hypothetical protein
MWLEKPELATTLASSGFSVLAWLHGGEVTQQ